MIIAGKLLLFGLLLVVVVWASVIVVVVGAAAAASSSKLRGTKSAFSAHISFLSVPSQGGG